VRPSGVTRSAAPGLSIEDISGVAYDPLRDRFRLGDPAINYMLFATRAEPHAACDSGDA
jgi:2-polyprenyl-3-methyl-5-hydroxy-6-metoxy-1,4-benzoquinol methylase